MTGSKASPDGSAAPDRGDVLHALLKLSNRLMAPFSTHLSARYRISLNEFRLLMPIGRLGTGGGGGGGGGAMNWPRSPASM